MSFEVLSLGSNGGGQLGIGHLDDVSEPTKCLFPFDQQPTLRPEKIVAGGNHTLMLFEGGFVYATGLNEDGRCGIEPQAEPLTSFRRVVFQGSSRQTVDRFKDVAASWEASIFVTLDDEIYTCGSGSKGELGHGESCTELTYPKLVSISLAPGETVRAVSACMSHVVVVSSAGRTYGWGAGRKGQLGELSVNVVSPRSFGDDSSHWESAVCGRDFTILVKEGHTGRCDILGDDRWRVRTSRPDKTPFKHQVAATWGSAYILSTTGNLISWGRNDHGQLPPANLPKLGAIAAGSEHGLGETEDGAVVAWGWGEHGNCGRPIDARGDVKDSWNVLGKGKLLGGGCATSWMAVDRSP